MGSRNNKPGRIVKGTALQPTLKDASGIWSLDEAMQAHRANAWPQPNLFQPVGNSLRNSLGKTGYISRESPGRSGSQRKFTFSWWLKKNSNATSSQQHLFYSYDGSRLLQIFFERGGNTNPDCICVYGGGTDLRFTPVLRDTSAWYNIVIAVDIDQSTSANTIKCWINGVQITAVGTQGGSPGTPSYPTSATNWPINQAGVYQRIGGNAGGGTMDGQFAEINFVDGAQLQPTLFGQFDTNNTWVPIPYTGSYGTNGFYLPFNNATTSQTLGYDASLNGTAIYDADQDPYRGHVALHLTGNGPAGGQNNTFADSSTNNLAITRNGSVTQGSFSPFPLNTNTPYNPAIHGGSAYFGTTTSDNIYAASNSALTIGTNNFTLEFWANWTAWSGEQRLILMGQSGSSAIEIGRGTASNILQVYTNTSLKISYSWSPTIGAWNHIAVVRSGTGAGQLTLYINGVNVATGTSADSISTNNFFVGGLNWATGYNMQGYISNVRLINGAAVYTAAFTPTMRPFGTLTNNLITFSENFTSAWWASNTSNIEGTAVAPDGTPSATTLVAGTYPVIAGVGSSTVAVTGSIYAKANVGNQLTFRLNRWGSGADYVEVIFNLTTGTATGATTAGTASGLATSIVNVGNGWWRCVISGTTSTTGGAISFNPNPTSGSIFIWGAQLETGGTATTYTPTPANFSTAPALLLNFANAAVVDTAGAQTLLTASGATITNSSKYGSGALSFNGSTDYLQSPAVGLNAFGASDFTIEAWINFSSVANGQLVSAGTGGQTNAYYWQYYSSQLQFGVQGIGSVTVVNWTPTANIWYHVCVMRQGPNYYQFVNGQQISVATYSQSWVDGPTYIGYGGAGYFNGKMDDVRITRGVARYSFSGFTPPARALPEVGGKSFVTTNINAGVVKSFTTTGTTSWTAPVDVTQVEVLVVAGGGAGGNNHAGGGGGGGLIYNNQYPVTPGQTYTVTVGSGGLASGTGANNNTNGGNSQFGALTAIGGGAGGNRNDTAGTSPGQNGGSGGGGGGAQAPYAGCYVAGLGTAGQGFSGGVAVDILGGGGGGAGGVGAAGVGTRVGGNGLQFGVSGTPQYYAGGGGGSSGSTPSAAGGLGGGGTSGTTSGSNGTAGTANTGGGGGGGGAGNTTGSNGGSGVVIVRYTTTLVANTSDATTDNLVDSPTLYGHDTGAGGEVVGNYATANPLDTRATALTYRNGNLTLVGATSNGHTRSTIGPTSGKWYWEITCLSTSPNFHHGISSGNVQNALTGADYLGAYSNEWGYWPNTSGTSIAYWRNSGSTVYTDLPRAVQNDVMMFALDIDNGKIYAGINGVWFKSGNPAAGTNALSTNIPTNGTPVFPHFMQYDSGGISINFGQRAWAYTPPAGYNALTTKNFARPAVGSAAATPNQYFDSILYTGTGAAQTITLPGTFQPDLVWMKARSLADNHVLMDSVRGTSAAIFSDLTNAEVTNATRITSFNSNGFTLGTSASVNTSSATYVAWCWKAGGTPVTNTAGAITSQVSANTASGFSVVTYTGSGTQASVGHGLSAAPELIITKARNQTGGWYTYTTVIDGSMDYFFLNTAAAKGDSGLAVPTSTVFYNDGWAATHNMVAYCFHSVAGYSKIGTYTGNGSADGPFIYTGFKPRWIMVKEATGTNAATGSWQIFDTARDLGNPSDNRLKANVSDGEAGSAPSWDVVSNGFKLRSTNSNWNESAGVYIYMAFADKPFGNVNGTAR